MDNPNNYRAITLKTGDMENQHIYRAITLGSFFVILFAFGMLERLIKFRSQCCPDPTNQLGFCKGSQTSDHILTLKALKEII